MFCVSWSDGDYGDDGDDDDGVSETHEGASVIPGTGMKYS